MDEAWSYQYFSTSDYDMDRTHQSRWNMNGNLYCPVSYILLSPAKDEKNKIKITSGGLPSYKIILLLLPLEAVNPLFYYIGLRF